MLHYMSGLPNVMVAKLGTKDITENGTYSASADNLDGYSQVTANVNNAFVINVAELPNTTFRLYNNTPTLLDTKTNGVTGGKVSFVVTSAGTYTIEAEQSSTIIWTNTVIIDKIGEYDCKSGKALTNYTASELHTLCQTACISTMFSPKDKWTFTQAGSLFDNYVFFIEDIITSGTQEQIQFRMAKYYSAYNQKVNNSIQYLTALNATVWTKTQSNNGGWKYCDMRRLMQKAGEPTWSMAGSLKPNDNLSLTGGIFLSDFKYSDTGVVANIYDYDKATDTMNIASDLYVGTAANVRINAQFVKGYFKYLGTLDETTFNNGHYYTRTLVPNTGYFYTTATTWGSTTNYVGFYEFLQEDGGYVTAISSLSDYLIRFNNYSSAGGTQLTYVNNTQDYVNLPSIEEMYGINANSTTFSGSLARNIGYTNSPNEGTKKQAYDDIGIYQTNSTMFTRSCAQTNLSLATSQTGGLSTVSVDSAGSSYYTRMGFIIG